MFGKIRAKKKKKNEMCPKNSSISRIKSVIFQYAVITERNLTKVKTHREEKIVIKKKRKYEKKKV